MMKKSIFIATVVMVLLAGFESMAGNSANTRKHCRWYAKRYAVNCHLSTFKCGIKYSWTHDGDCSWAYRDLQRTWCCAATSVSHAESSGSGHYTYLYKYCGVNGGLPTDLLTDADGGPDTSKVDPNIMPEGTQEQKVIPAFGTNDITLSGISITLTTANTSIDVNTATFAAWLPQDDTVTGVEDTLYDPSKAIVSGTVSLKDGRLTVTGDIFSVRDFTLTKKGVNYVATYVGGDKVVRIPAAINIDDVAFVSTGDINDDPKKVMKGLATTSNGVISGEAKLEVYPNPAASNLNLQFSNTKQADVSVSIYDNVGKRIRVIEHLSLTDGNTNLGIDISSLPAGSYFMLVKGENMKIVKQFVKN